MKITAANVPRIRAISGGGIMFASFLGVKNTIIKVSTPRITLYKSVFPICFTTFITPSIGVPVKSSPKNEFTCKRIIIAPMPLINPDITGYGIKFTSFPTFKSPSII